MTILTSNERDHLSTTVFGLPSERKYPMPDKAHARDAKARASEEYRKGRLTKAQRDEIFMHADRVLGHKSTAEVLYNGK